MSDEDRGNSAKNLKGIAGSVALTIAAKGWAR